MLIETKVKGLDILEKYMRPEIYRKAMQRSLQRGGTAAKAEMPRAIKAIYAIKMTSTVIKSEVSYRVYNSSQLLLTARGDRGVSLTKYYGAKDVSKQFRSRRGVKTISGGYSKSLYPKFSFRIKVGGAIGYIKGVPKRQPFIASTASGYSGIFQRDGRDRLPINTFYGPGLGQLVRSREVVNRVQARVNDVIGVELQRNWNYYSGRV